MTYSGVSTLKVVAAIEAPASHHGIARPPTKNSARLFEPRRASSMRNITNTTRNPAIITIITMNESSRFISRMSGRWI